MVGTAVVTAVKGLRRKRAIGKAPGGRAAELSLERLVGFVGSCPSFTSLPSVAGCSLAFVPSLPLKCPSE